MGHVQRRDAQTRLHLTDLLAQLHAHLGVERRQRLVEQQDGRLDGECAGQGDALLLAARQLVRVVADALGQSDQAEQLLGALATVDTRLLAHAHAELDVLPSRHVGEQAVRLEHHAHVAFGGRHADEVGAVDQQLSVGRLLEAGHDPQGGGLAAAARPEQRHELARCDRQRQLLERHRRAEHLADTLEIKRGHSRSSPADRRALPHAAATSARHEEQDHHGAPRQREADDRKGRSLVCLGIANIVNVDGERVEEQEARDRVLAHHDRQGKERACEHRGPDVRQDDEQECLPAGRAAALGRLSQRTHVDGPHAGVERAIGERQRQDHVDERQDQPPVTEQPGHDLEGAREPDHQGDRRHHERQDRDDIHDRAELRQAQVDPVDRRHHEQHADDHGLGGDLERDHEGRPELGIAERLRVPLQPVLVRADVEADQQGREERHEKVQRRHDEPEPGPERHMLALAVRAPRPVFDDSGRVRGGLGPGRAHRATSAILPTAVAAGSREAR